MGMLDFQFRAPEVATVVRWILRLVLVGFLAWLVKGRQEQDQEEDDQDDEVDNAQRQRQMAHRGQRLPNNGRDPYKTQPNRRDPYAPRDVRQRRPVNSESVDFDAVINKMSKPKNMWDVQKSGAAPQILKPTEITEASQKPAVPSREKRHSAGKDEASLLKINVLHGHGRPVTWITWNRDGNLLFTCGKDKKVCVWSFPDGECLGTYEGHSGAVWACSVTADSSWLVTGGADQCVIVWEARASRELARIELPGVCRFVEWACTGSKGSERFATVHNKFGSNPPAITVFLFDGETIQQQLRIDKLPGPCTQARWGRDDLLIASSHDNGELIFWKADSGEEVRRLKVHDAPISKFDFSTDRQLVATASTDKKVKIWDLGEEGSGEGKLLFEAATDRPLNAVSLGCLSRSVAIGAESDRPRNCVVIAAGGQDTRDVALSKAVESEFDTLLFKLAGEEKLEDMDKNVKGHFGPVHTLAFTADGTAMASGSEDGCVRLHMFSDSAPAK